MRRLLAALGLAARAAARPLPSPLRDPRAIALHPRRRRSRLSGVAGEASRALPCRPPARPLPAPAGPRYGSVGGGRGARAEVTGGGGEGAEKRA